MYQGERSTEDIDLVQVSHPTKSREATQNELFRFTQGTWGMGPEYVNLAVDFFVRDLEGWEKELVLLKSGPAGRVFGPTLTLFCALKIRRGTELDLNDIRAAFRTEGTLGINFETLAAWVGSDQIARIRQLMSTKPES